MAKQASIANTISNYPKFHHFAPGTRSQHGIHENAFNSVLKAIADESQFDLKQASDLTKAATLQDPESEEKLIRFAKEGKASPDEVIRMIRIFECICSKSELLDRLLRLESIEQPRIRSKVVLTIGRLVQNSGWLREQLQDLNARVRANAVEALWEIQVEGAEELLLRAALDSNNRVIGNAALGLYRLSNPKAIPILYSLLRHSDKLFRSTGLWTITQLGDPRFLDSLQPLSTDHVEDAEETRLRESARQRLAAYLKFSQFAGKLNLDLSSFKTTGQKTRLVKLACLSSEADIWFSPPELNKLNFVIEENGRQVEAFDCCWIEPDEKVSSAIIAPASLSVRGRPLRALAEEAALSEAVSIIRYLPSSASAVRNHRSWLAENQAISFSKGFSSQNFPVSRNLQEAILQGLEHLNSSSGPRHLFLVVDRSAEGKLPANIQKLARISNIVIHALVSEDAQEELAQTLNTLSLKSGGAFLRSDSAEALLAMVSSVRARYAHSCELSWTGFEKTPTGIKIRCISGCGYGEVVIAGQKE